jgi:hypothetical protein
MARTEIPVLMFFRKHNGEDFFYFVDVDLRDGDLKEQAEQMAILNPGTLQVKDANGNVLWCLQ